MAVISSEHEQGCTSLFHACDFFFFFVQGKWGTCLFKQNRHQTLHPSCFTPESQLWKLEVQISLMLGQQWLAHLQNQFLALTVVCFSFSFFFLYCILSFENFSLFHHLIILETVCVTVILLVRVQIWFMTLQLTRL